MMDQRRAIQIYLENRDKFQGVPQSDAVNLIRRSGGLPAAAVAPAETAPTAIPVAAPAAPVAAALAAAAPPPVPMAAPAPVVEDEPTPAPAPEYMNQYETALAAYNLANPETPAPVAVKGKPVDYAAKARQAVTDRQRQELEANVEIARNAKIDPETQKVIDSRLARYGTQITEADKDRKQATWMAVAQAGMKMAQSQSPYFMQALASGMEAGIEGYSEAKAKAAEKKARLQDAKEDLAMKAIELRAQAVKDAIGVRLASKQAAAADTALQKDALGVLLGEQTAADVVESARLGNLQTRANIRNIESQIITRAADNARAERAARSGGTGGGVGIKLSQLNPIVNGAISENDRLTEQLNDPIISSQLSPAKKNAIRNRIVANEQIIAYGRSLQKQKIGMGGMTFGQEK
jgi:hypothetical protein